MNEKKNKGTRLASFFAPTCFVSLAAVGGGVSLLPADHNFPVAVGQVPALVPQVELFGEVVDDVAELAAVLGGEGQLVARRVVLEVGGGELDPPGKFSQQFLDGHVEAERLLR